MAIKQEYSEKQRINLCLLAMSAALKLKKNTIDSEAMVKKRTGGADGRKNKAITTKTKTPVALFWGSEGCW